MTSGREVGICPDDTALPGERNTGDDESCVPVKTTHYRRGPLAQLEHPLEYAGEL